MVAFILIVALLGTGFVWSTEIEDGVNGILGNQRSPDIIEFDGGLAINFIDVGQGDAALLQFPGGERMLVDAGRWDRTHNRFRRELNSLVPGSGHGRIIDYFIATHSHADHIGSAYYVVQNYTVRNIVRPKSFTTGEIGNNVPAQFGLNTSVLQPVEHNSVNFQRLITQMQYSFGSRTQSIAIPRVGGPHGFTAGQQNLTIGSFTIGTGASEAIVTFYSPSTHRYGTSTTTSTSDINRTSTIFCVYFNGFRILFTGDSYVVNETNTLNNLAVPLPQNICILVVSHHGGNTSTSQAFVDHLDPTHAIIQVGTTSTGNTYGHPHNIVIQRLQDADIHIHTTRDLGDILVRVSSCGNFVEVAGFRAPDIWIYYWWMAIVGVVISFGLLLTWDLFGRKNNNGRNNNRNQNTRRR